MTETEPALDTARRLLRQAMDAVRAAAGPGASDDELVAVLGLCESVVRRADVAARDRGCAHPRCDRTPAWSEVHPVHEWELGGETRLSNLVMLRRVHHREIHFTEWVVRIRDGLPEFLPPLWIDPTQTPRRKALPHLVRAG